MEKKPDNVAWDQNEARYVASIVPYATSVSGPVIKLDDVSAFKERGIHKAQKTFSTKYEELINEYQAMLEEIKLNELIYNSKYSFEPIVGYTYHLYENSAGVNFLSLISPSEWRMKHLVSVRLDSEHKWVKI